MMRSAFRVVAGVLLGAVLVAPLGVFAEEETTNYCAISKADTQGTLYAASVIKQVQAAVGASQSGKWNDATVTALCNYQRNTCAAAPACDAAVAITNMDIAADMGAAATMELPDLSTGIEDTHITIQDMVNQKGPCVGKTGQDLLQCSLVEPSKGDKARYEGKDETSLIRFAISLVTGLIGTLALIFVFRNAVRLLTADGSQDDFNTAIRSIALGAVGLILAGAAYAIIGALIDIDILS